MKNILYIVFVVILLTAGFYVLKVDDATINNSATYSKPELGLQFNYPSGPTGYVVQESTPVDNKVNLLRSIVLIQSEDAEREMPVGGEGPATITILVFKNAKKQFPGVWAEQNIQYSNINLKVGDVVSTVVGGANAIRYKSDGLYASDNVVVAHGDNVYMFAGQYMDENSELRRDFQPIIDSITFIQSPNQQ